MIKWMRSGGPGMTEQFILKNFCSINTNFSVQVCILDVLDNLRWSPLSEAQNSIIWWVFRSLGVQHVLSTHVTKTIAVALQNMESGHCGMKEHRDTFTM